MFYVIAGDQSRELKEKELIDKIVKENIGINQKIFDGQLGEHEAFLQQASTNSLFGGRELLVLKRGEGVKKVEEVIKALSAIDLTNKEIIMSIETDEKGLSKKIIGLVESFGEIFTILQDKKGDKGLIEYIKSELNVDNKIAINLVEMIGNNVLKLKNEIEKLKNYFYKQEFNLEKAKKLISINEEYNLFEQVDKLLKGEKKSVIDFLNKEKKGQIFLFWLGQELKELLKLSILVNEGKLVFSNNYNQFKVKFDENSDYFKGKHPYRVFKTMENLKKFSEEKLKSLIGDLLDTEYKIKSGFGEEEILINILILKV
jgi:DNA polymerase-3 subunit delta